MRRAQLLACAMRVFARRGVAAARHAEVAAAAGVSVPTVFVYFPTRDALVAAVLDEVGRFYLALARRSHAGARPAPEVLLGHVAAFAASVDSHPDHARVWLGWSSAVGGDAWPRYRALERRVIELIAGTLRRGQAEGTLARDIPPEDGARIALGAGTMLAQMKLGGQPRADVERFQTALVRALSGGLADA